MEDVVQGESRTTTTANGAKQTGNLFGKVNIVVKCGQKKRVITLVDVMYISGAPCNLVSNGKFYRKGLFLDTQRNVIHNGKDVIANCPMLEGTDVQILELDPEHGKLSRQPGLSLAAIKKTESSFEVWHRRLLHAGDETVIRTMVAMGLQATRPDNWSCQTCMLARAPRMVSRETPTRSQEPCAEIHTDTIPMKPQGIGGFNYFMTIIDSATMYTWTVPLVSKNEAGPKLHNFIRWLERQSGQLVKTIMRDGGKEYLPTEAREFAGEKGITVRETAPRTPEQNGKAEVVGRYIVEMARAARIEAGLPEFLWPLAVKHAVTIRNLTPKRALDWKSPHELLGRALNLPERSVEPYTKHLRTFGCEAYVRIPMEDPDFVKARKTKERSRQGMFVGTEGLRGHIYVVWVPEKHRLFRSRDVQFREVGEDLPSRELDLIPVRDEDETYRVVIPKVRFEDTADQEDNRDIAQEEATVEAEVSTPPANPRYATPQSLQSPVHLDGDETWYPADIDPSTEEPESVSGPIRQESLQPVEELIKEPTEEPKEQKKKLRQSKKDRPPEQPTRESTRSNKGQYADPFFQKHYTSYVAFVAAQIQKYFVPSSFKEAMSCPDREFWLDACNKQLDKINKKKTWELCDLPTGQRAIPTKWVFDPKQRARLVMCGNFEKKSEIETFAAVVNMTMVKVFFLVVATLDWECYQFDFEGAFLNGIMSERSVYVQQPPGFGDGTKKVYKLLKTLYGLRDSPLVWSREVSTLMSKVGFRPLLSESCVFVNEDKSIWIMVYVDDVAIAARTKAEIDGVAYKLGSKFTLTEIGEVKTFLGLRLLRNRKLRTVHISQAPYIKRVLGKKGWTKLNGVGTPLDNRIKYDRNLLVLEGQEKAEFLELVGSAQWISNNTRPDMAYAANFLGRHRQHPTGQHLGQIKRVWRYLNRTMNFGLILGGAQSLSELDLWLHCDASWADDPVTRKTTAGHIIYVGNSPIKWQSKQQDLVTLSTTEAEFVNMSTAGRDMLWIRQLIRDVQIPASKVPIIGTDSRNALLAAEGDRQNMSTRHTDVRYKWIKEKVRTGELTLKWIETREMKADGLTKALNAVQQARFIALIGLTEVIESEEDEIKREDPEGDGSVT